MNYKKAITLTFVLTAMPLTAPAIAQILPPSTVPIVPTPSRPPPPPVYIPAVPKFDVIEQPSLKPLRRRSYSDRVTQCLADGAALGLGPNRRAAYSRRCANQ